MNLVLVVLLSVLAVLLLGALSSWAMKGGARSSSDESRSSQPTRWSRLLDSITARRQLIIPAMSVLLALGFAFSLEGFSEEGDVSAAESLPRDTSRPSQGAVSPSPTPLVVQSSSRPLFLHAGLTPAIRRIEEVARSGRLNIKDEEAIGYGIIDIKAHILEVTFDRTRVLEENGFRIDSYKEDQWIDGVYYVSRTVLELTRADSSAKTFLLSIMPKLDLEADPADAGFVRIGDQGDPEQLHKHIRLHGLGDLGCLRLYDIPIDAKNVDSKGRVSLEVTIAAKQQTPFSMYAIDTRPYRLGIGSMEIALRFAQSSPISIWPGQLNVLDGAIKLVTSKEAESLGWNRSAERSNDVKIVNGLVRAIPNTEKDRSSLTYKIDGSLGSINPIIVGFWPEYRFPLANEK